MFDVGRKEGRQEGGRERKKNLPLGVNGRSVNVLFRNNVMITVLFSKLIRHLITNT